MTENHAGAAGTLGAAATPVTSLRRGPIRAYQWMLHALDGLLALGIAGFLYTRARRQR